MKDIYVKITHENMDYLHELRGFVSNWKYSKEERDFYRDDLGKIETNNCVFRFVKHVNVIKEKPFFLSKPDSNEMKDITLEEFEEALGGLMELTFLEKGILTYVDDDQLEIVKKFSGYLSFEAYPDKYKKIALENEKGRFLCFRIILKKGK